MPRLSESAGLAIAVGACALLFAARGWRLPGALLVLGGGLIGGIVVSGLPAGVGLGPGEVHLTLPGGGDFATALASLVLAQIPLTFGNSVVATADAERDYFGARAARVTPRRLAGSIAVCNAAAGLGAAMPVCHGAGGVTAHYRLGARRASATAFVGCLYLGLALAFGSSLAAVLMLLLPGVLAGMLLYVALQHALLAAELKHADDRLIAAGIGLLTIISGNLAFGFAAGAVVVVARHLIRPAAGRGGSDLASVQP